MRNSQKLCILESGAIGTRHRQGFSTILYSKEFLERFSDAAKQRIIQLHGQFDGVERSTLEKILVDENL